MCATIRRQPRCVSALRRSDWWAVPWSRLVLSHAECNSPECQECQPGGRCSLCSPGHVVRDYECVKWDEYLCLSPGDPHVGCEGCASGTTTHVNCPKTDRTVECAFASVSKDGTQCHRLYDDAATETITTTCEMSNGRCVKCHDGFYPSFQQHNGAQTCIPCDEGCQVCDETQCFVCAKGYVLSQDKTGCQVDDTHSKECSDGHFVKNGICQTCPSGCVSCLDETTCVQCRGGFVNVDGFCVSQATAHCKTVNGQTCIQCLDGFHLTTTACVPNAGGCLHETTTGCLECEDGMVLLRDANGKTTCELSVSTTACALGSSKGCLRCTGKRFDQRGVCRLCDAD